MDREDELAQGRRDPSSTMDSQVAEGTVLFGEYEVLGVLGGGGMGWVYRARHRSLGTLRAIKVIRPDLTFDPQVEEMFVREAEALIRTHHPAVVRCHDLLRDEKRIYLIMELVEGPSLTDYLRPGPMSPEKVRALRTRLAGGLAAAHAEGVVHRDVSPSNIILPQGKADQAKLIDFGVAKLESLVGPQRGQSMFKGKFEYASPEQCGLFGGRVGPQSDLYSLGLVLAEAASGAPLPMGQTFYEAIELRKVVPRIPPSVPPDLADEILPLLEPNPEDRPASADDLPLAKPKARAPEQSLQEERIEPQQELEEEPAVEENWLLKVSYSATAAGAGIGLGFMLWLWNSAK